MPEVRVIAQHAAVERDGSARAGARCMNRHWRVVSLMIAMLATAAGCSSSESSRPNGDESADELRTALTRSDLPAGPFRARSEALAQEWFDNNIMTGDARIDAGVLKGTLSSASMSTFSKKLVTDHLTRQERTYHGISAETPSYAETLVADAARAVAVEGFVYAPSAENIAPIEVNVRELLAFLGDSAKLDVVKVRGRCSDGDAERAVTQFLFVNRETKQYLAFYAREGTI